MKEVITEFWRCFAEHRLELKRIESADDPAYDVVLQALQQIDDGLYFEFCSTPGTNELIVTAEGKKELFPLVEEIVREAPHIDDWQVFALKPKRGFPVTTRWEQTKLLIGDVVVLPVFRETGEMALRLYIPGLSEKNQEDIHNALLRVLDSGLGERRFAECIEATWVYPLSDAPSQAFPLSDLDDYLDCRDAEG